MAIHSITVSHMDPNFSSEGLIKAIYVRITVTAAPALAEFDILANSLLMDETKALLCLLSIPMKEKIAAAAKPIKAMVLSLGSIAMLEAENSE